MPKRSNEFQRLIAFIENEFSHAAVNVTESELVYDKINNVEREVDILVQGEINGYQISIGIECRDRKRKADILWIDEIIGKYQSLPIDRKVAVSKSGFTKSAMEKADKCNIETLTLEDALNTDWIETVERIVKWNMEGRKLIFHSFGFNFEDNIVQTPESFCKSSVLYNSKDKPVGKVQDFIDWVIDNPPEIENAIQREINNMRPNLQEGVNRFKIILSVPLSLTFEEPNHKKCKIVSVTIVIECRIEILNPEIDEYKYKEKYLAIAKSKFSDAPVEIVAAAVSSGKKGDEIKMLFSSNQEIISIGEED